MGLEVAQTRVLNRRALAARFGASMVGRLSVDEADLEVSRTAGREASHDGRRVIPVGPLAAREVAARVGVVFG